MAAGNAGMPGIELRDYQRECIEAIDRAGSGSHLVVMATGLGKTVTFANIPRHGRVLLLSHRDELVRQPERYYDCSFGIEKAGERSHGEEVVSATVQTLASDKRLSAFEPGDFDMVITDEAHHAVAKTYRRIVDYLAPRVHLGFTATPNRADGKGLVAAFDDIVFERDLRWGIEHGYLSDIDCRRVTVGWSTKGVRRQAGDFSISELESRVNTASNNYQVATAYRELAVGQTLVFASSVDHANELQALIPRSVVVDGKTPPQERRDLIRAFTERRFPCLINFGVFTEGTDLPLIETVLLARPTTNQALYAQMVGRGLRLSEGKEALRLIDCVGSTVDNRLCTAPSLFGIDESELTEEARSKVNGLITQLPKRIEDADSTPYGWVLRERRVDLLEKEERVAWVSAAGGHRSVEGDGWSCSLTGPDLVGNWTMRFRDGETRLAERYSSFADADARAAQLLAWGGASRKARALWDSARVAKWAGQPASDAQVSYLLQLLDPEQRLKLGKERLTRREAMVAIEAALKAEEDRKAEAFGRCPVCGRAMKVTKSGKSYQCVSNRWGKSAWGKWRLEDGCGFAIPSEIEGKRLTTYQVKALVEGEKVALAGGKSAILRKGWGGSYRVKTC